MTYNIYKIVRKNSSIIDLQKNVQIIHSIIIILNEIEIEQNVLKLNFLFLHLRFVITFRAFYVFRRGTDIYGVLRSRYGLELLNKSNINI